MKLRNERAMCIVIYIYLNFRGTASQYDENDDLDSDFIPFISLGLEKENGLMASTISSRSNKLSLQRRNFSANNPQLYHVPSSTKVPIKNSKFSENTIKRVSEVNELLPHSYKTAVGSNTGDPNRNRGNVGANVLHTKSGDLLNKREKVTSDNTPDFKQLGKYNTDSSTDADKRTLHHEVKSNNEHFEHYVFSRFFDSLLTLLNYLNPNLLDSLEANIKMVEMFNVMKRNISLDDDDECSTVKSLVCNCDYCRTGTPDTVLYIVSGKKLNNSVTYHKLTSGRRHSSINRPKLKTSFSYQLQTADDKDSNRSFLASYLPGNNGNPILKYKYNNTTDKEDKNIDEKVKESNIEPPRLTLAPISANMGKRLMTAYQGLSGLGFYKQPRGLRTLSRKHGTYNSRLHHSNSFNNGDNWNHEGITNHHPVTLPYGYFKRPRNNEGLSTISINKSHETTMPKYVAFIINNQSDLNVRHITNGVANESILPTSTKIDVPTYNYLNRYNKIDFKSMTNDGAYHSLHIATDPVIDNPSVKKVTQSIVTEEMNNEENETSEPLQDSLLDIINKMMERVGEGTTLVTNETEGSRETVTLGDESNSTYKMKSTMRSPIARNYSKHDPWSNYQEVSKYTTRSKKLKWFKIPAVFKHVSKNPDNVTPIMIMSNTINNNSINKNETYVNYDLNLRNLIGESNIDERIMCS